MEWQFWVGSAALPLLFMLAGWVHRSFTRLADRLEKVSDAIPDQMPLVSRIANVEGDLRMAKVDREAGDKASEAYTQTKVAELHNRINATRDDYVRRDDFNRDMANVTQQLADLRSEIKTDTARINQRLDMILSVLGRQAPAAE